MIEEFRKEMESLVRKYENKGLFIDRVIIKREIEEDINNTSLNIIYTESIFK